jgi:flagellar basal body-associated protein FliL
LQAQRNRTGLRTVEQEDGAPRATTKERSVVLIAYYLVFCLLCCAGLVAMMRHDRSHTDRSESTD